MLHADAYQNPDIQRYINLYRAIEHFMQAPNAMLYFAPM